MSDDVTVHIGSIQESEKDGEPELQFASREFDHRVADELKGFLDDEIAASSGLIMM